MNIGLEVHFQLNTMTKLFCACRNRTGQKPNSDVCPVCCGLPGVLPVLNDNALEKALKAAIALGMEIHRQIQFDRKNYFYPDLPKGYQISQLNYPVAINGMFEIWSLEGVRKIPISRLHLEEDAGKTIFNTATDNRFLDFNRCGTPLIEIVTLPELHSSEEAATFVRWLRSMMLYLGVCNGNMETGDIRVDVNISIKKDAAGDLGPKVELKNLNSIRYMKNAIDFEISRQTRRMAAGQSVCQETRFWDEKIKETGSLRNKENAEDYRYLPEPDLTAVPVSLNRINDLKEALPERFSRKMSRFINDCGLPVRDAEIIAEYPETAAYFESVLISGLNPALVSRWLINDVLSRVKDPSRIDRFYLKPDSLSQLIALVVDGKITRRSAKRVMDIMAQTKRPVLEIVKAHHLYRMDDADEIDKIIQLVVDDNQKILDEFKGGPEQKKVFLTGLVMKATHGRADPKILVNRIETRYL